MIWEEEQKCEYFLQNTEQPENKCFRIAQMFFELRNLLTYLGRVLQSSQKSQYFPGHSDLIVYCSKKPLVDFGIESCILDESQELIYRNEVPYLYRQF